MRQRGITSPKPFNLYINQVIVELSNTQIGCHIDGVCINNISYADDMVLQLRLQLYGVYWSSARNMRWLTDSDCNAKKSELMLFKAGTKHYSNVPPLMLRGTPLKRVTAFKYLGH